MTVSNTNTKITYTGNAATTVWSYSFDIPSLDEMQVVLTEVASGAETVVDPSQYTVTGVGDANGGTVTYPTSGSPLTSDYMITIARLVTYTQNATMSNQGAQYPTAYENALDAMEFQIQQLAETISRALVFGIADTNSGQLPSAAARADGYLKFDTNGNPTIASSVIQNSVSVSAYMTTVVAAASAAAARTLLGVGVTGTLGQATADTILGNPSGSTADPSYNSLVSYLARLSNTRGDTLVRGSSAWNALALGGAGTVLGSDGTDLAYVNQSIGEKKYSNLVVTATTGTAATITADWITLVNSSYTPYLTRSASLTINTATTGANGLDTGSAANNTWYAVWVIYNPSTATTAALLSTSSSAPTMPSGYTFKARVGWLRTNGSAALKSTVQYGNRAQYKTIQGLTSGTSAGSDISTPSWVATSVSSFVPTTASEIMLSAGILGAIFATGMIMAPNNSYGGIGSTSNLPPIIKYSATTAGTTINIYNIGTESMVLESSNIYYASSTSASYVNCMGWVDNL